jgi:hypothetical protein
LIRYQPWVAALEEQANKNHPLSSRFAGADLFWASPIRFTLPESGTVSGEVLFSSTPDAWMMTKNFALRPEQSALFFAEEEETRGEKSLAAALEGTFPSWFEAVDKPRRETGEWNEESWETTVVDELPDMPSQPKESRIVVVGDVDMGSPLIQYTQEQQSINLDFLLQAADWLGNDDDIVGIRNRRSGSGRLDRISNESMRLGVMGFSRILNLFILPIVIIIFGVYRLLKRKYKAGVTVAGGTAVATPKEQDHV